MNDRWCHHLEIPKVACCDTMDFDSICAGLVNFLSGLHRIPKELTTALSKIQVLLLHYDSPNTKKYFEISNVTLTYQHWCLGAKIKKMILFEILF